jgi:putative membrane protein
MNDMQGDARHRFEVRMTSDSHFSWLRTRLSVERTMMSWVRTSTALIGFGFTIVQFFERLGHTEAVKAALRPHAARYVGLALIAAGILALLISTWQYRVTVRYLRGGDFAPLAGLSDKTMHTPVFIVALCLVLIGVFAFAAVWLRVV